MMGIVVTIPARCDFAAWRSQFDAHPDALFIWTVRHPPARSSVAGGRLYFVHRGFAKGWCAIECLGTPGATPAILFRAPLRPCAPAPCRGFRGWRYLRGDMAAALA